MKIWKTISWTPKVCKIMAFMAIIMGLGLVFYILLGFRISHSTSIMTSPYSAKLRKQQRTYTMSPNKQMRNWNSCHPWSFRGKVADNSFACDFPGDCLRRLGRVSHKTRMALRYVRCIHSSKNTRLLDISRPGAVTLLRTFPLAFCWRPKRLRLSSRFSCIRLAFLHCRKTMVRNAISQNSILFQR